MRKIAITGFKEESRKIFKEKLPGWEIALSPNRADIDKLAVGAEILLGWCGKELVEKNPSLKWIQLLSAGVDYMPFDILKERGVYLTNASGVHANSISESILGMMLGFSRKLFAIHKNQINGEWTGGIAGLTEIHGKTIGIIGTGAIGKETARLAKAFNMRTIGMRRSGEPLEYIDVMYGADGLNKLLAESDYVVNIVPATKATINMINDDAFKAMKNTAVYITVGRGNTTDTDAIIRALNSGEIAAAGLDVVEPEPLPSDSPLWKMDNVFIGGHNAGGTDKYMERALEIFLANLEDYLAGRKPGRNLVDMDLQY